MTPARKRICILGSTGSIGVRTLDVIRDAPDRYQVVGLSAHRSAGRLHAQVEEFTPVGACITGDSGGASPADRRTGRASGTRWFSGPGGALDLIDACEADLVVVAMVGAAGVLPTLHAIRAGATIGLANKETLVTAGELVMREAGARGVALLPIDSEHNAIFQCLHGQCLAGELRAALRRVILTASGGPFRGRSRAELAGVTVAEALRHPTWNMGRKISIDSATLMNKGFEAIEARHLFDVGADRIDVVVHPQSVVHSMVEFVDGSVIAQLGATDMYFPIANVLSHPERLPNDRYPSLDLVKVGVLEFEAPDTEAFPCLRFAFEAIRRGGRFPAVLNAANEVAVERFLEGEIGFLEIPGRIEAALEAHDAEGDSPEAALDLEAIREADARARSRVAAD